MTKKPGRRSQNRPPKRNTDRQVTAAPESPTPQQEDLAAVSELMRDTKFVLMAANAGLDPVEAADRSELLSGISALSTVQELAKWFSRLDLERMNIRPSSGTELKLAGLVQTAWGESLKSQIRDGHHLLTARSLAQLIRECIEYGSTQDDAPALEPDVLVQCLLSINTEQYRHPEYSDTGLVSEGAMERMAHDLVGLSAEDSVEKIREGIPGEVANALADYILSPTALRAETERRWFRPWPDKVTRPELGTCPADAFETTHAVPLVDFLALGKIVDVLALEGKIAFTRSDLITRGASSAAVDLCFTETSRPVAQYKKELTGDRRYGSVHRQRYTMTRFPFLQIDDETLLLLRYQWGIDRFFGDLLYWSTFARLPGFKMPTPTPGSEAEAFSSGMNDVFERSVGDILSVVTASSLTAERIITESEMQTLWTTSSRATASACDWVVKAGKACIVIDATNHSLDMFLSQGVGTLAAYAADMTKIFASHDGKFGQLVKTVTQLRDHGVEDFGLHRATVFMPVIVLPFGGVPNLDSTDLDLQWRSHPFFEEFNGRILAPTVITVDELQLLEGMAGRFGYPDPVKVFVQWRYVCTASPVPISFRDYLSQFVGAPYYPQARRLLDDDKALLRRIAGASD
nr:hypothetical protein [Rhodococcus sp. 15-649-1-2]